jgi:hypothetical protein
VAGFAAEVSSKYSKKICPIDKVTTFRRDDC